MESQERTKRCAMCGEIKGYSGFTLRPSGTPIAYCRPCMSKRVSERAMQQRRDQGVPERGPRDKLVAGLPEGFKRCSRCDQILALSEFPLRGGGGFRSMCQPCKRAEKTEYNHQNREKRRVAGSAYRQANKETLAERQRIWRVENPESDHAIHSRWKSENKDKVNASTHKRRNQIVCNGGHWTAQEWADLKAKYDDHCLMCGKQEPEIKLTVDHIVPVSAGGSNCIDNLQPLCKSCNSLKHRGIVDLRRKE